MKEQLIHILDQSTCLTRRQMKDYLDGTMLQEEMHAAEVHLSSCPLCNMAMEGFSAHTEEALQAISGLNSGFLKDHFARSAPQIHLNSMAPAATMPHEKRKGQSVSVWRVGSVAAALLLGCGIMWYLKSARQGMPNTSLASRNTGFEARSVPAPQPVANETTPRQEMVTADIAPPLQEPLKGDRKEQNELKSGIKQSPRPVALPAPTTIVEKKDNNAAAGYLASGSAGQEHMTALQEDKYSTPEPSAAPPAADRQPAGNTIPESQSVSRASMTPRSFKEASLKAKAPPAADDGRSHMEQGDDLFEKGKWSSAVAHYREEMNTGSRNNRHQAAIMAAKCYLSLGQKQRAIQLLQNVVADGGPQKRVAKRMLRDLQADE